MPSVHRQTGEQVGIAHDGAERRLKVVGDGKHHLLARGQQVLGTAAGFFQFAAIAVAARNVAPYDYQEKDGKQFVEIGMWVDQDISSIGTIYDGVAIQ